MKNSWIAPLILVTIMGAKASAQGYPNYYGGYGQAQPYWNGWQSPQQSQHSRYYQNYYSYPTGQQTYAPQQVQRQAPAQNAPTQAVSEPNRLAVSATEKLHSPEAADQGEQKHDTSHHAPKESPQHHEPVEVEPYVEGAPYTPYSAPCNHCAQHSFLNDCEPKRKLFASDRAFPTFIGPISNPVNSKDPRALTEARLLFINNWFPNDQPLFGGGDFQVYGVQLRLAVTDRLSILADKDGYVDIDPDVGPKRSGFINVAIGAKYAIVRDVENQLLVTPGFMYEPPTGDADVFSAHGDGLFTGFVTVGKGFCNGVHVLLNTGYQFPASTAKNSSYFFLSGHIDKRLCIWGRNLYPLLEVNWLRYTDGGNRGIPSFVGEGDGLINIGTSGVAGNDLVTAAVGLKTIIGKHLDVGVAYETPISNREDLIGHRLFVEAILRY